MPMQQLPLTHGAAAFAGAISLETTGAGVVPWRLPFADRDLFEPALCERARMAAGVRLTMRSDTRAIELAFEPADDLGDPMWRFDLVVDGQVQQRMPHAREAGRVRFEGWPEGEHDLELWLPQFGAIRVTGAWVDIGAEVKPVRDAQPRWVCYGSSITQCRTAAGPTETWPAIVALTHGLHLTCLGFGGQCKLDPPVARVIRDMPADLISVCLGINVFAGDLTRRTFRPAVLGVLQTIRDGHPHVPLACVSPVCSPPRENTGQPGLALVDMRQIIRDVVDLLRGRGDAKLHYIDGQELFGPDDVHMMPDELHPDAEGYRVLGRRYAATVMPRLGLPA
jgi:hypothetical protein